MTAALLILILVCKATQYPTISRAYNATESDRRKKQLLTILVCSLIADLSMLAVILYDTTHF